jgi:hypothetical protein
MNHLGALLRCLVCLLCLAGGWFRAEAAGDPGPTPRSFQHPGLLTSKAELDLIKSKIKAGTEPWRSSFERMKRSWVADLNWKPRAMAVVNANGQDASVENDDATAAYTHALLWYFTGNEAHARKSAEILNAWSATLTNHVSTDKQKALVAAWCGSVFPLAGEILRSTYPAWTAADIERFSAMLNRAFVPLIFPGNATYNGNWELSMSNALLAIGVFNNDAAVFDRGVFLWRKRMPAYFYLTTDGPTPIRPYGTTQFDSDAATKKNWHEPDQYFDGLCQETKRDYGHHMQMGLASAVNAAEIAHHQGIDLYGENDKRLIAAMEFQAGMMLGQPVSAEQFPQGFTAATPIPTWEIAYNHFHNRKGFALPQTDSLIRTKIRPSDFTTKLNLVWESMTHAELDAATPPSTKKTTP